MFHAWSLPFDKAVMLPTDVLMSGNCDGMMQLPELATVNWPMSEAGLVSTSRYKYLLLTSSICLQLTNLHRIGRGYYVLLPKKQTFKSLSEKWAKVLPFSVTVEVCFSLQILNCFIFRFLRIVNKNNVLFIQEFVKSSLDTSEIPTSMVSRWDVEEFTLDACVFPLPPTLLAAAIRRSAVSKDKIPQDIAQTVLKRDQLPAGALLLLKTWLDDLSNVNARLSKAMTAAFSRARSEKSG
jgi:hypothetical protein